jgi:hypothetical protein
MVPLERVELSTRGLGNRCSVHLSYRGRPHFQGFIIGKWQCFDNATHLDCLNPDCLTILLKLGVTAQEPGAGMQIFTEGQESAGSTPPSRSQPPL